jgi:excisionase family DNA binding protein
MKGAFSSTRYAVSNIPLGGDGASTPASPYMTTIETANYLRTTVQAVYGLVKRGRIKPMPGRPGRLLFRRQDLEEYLNGRFRR